MLKYNLVEIKISILCIQYKQDNSDSEYSILKYNLTET